MKKIFVVLFLVFGVLGNLICIVVLSQRWLLSSRRPNSMPKHNFNLFLLILAVNDFVWVVIYEASIYVFDMLPGFVCFFLDCIFYSLNVYGGCLTLIMSIDRLHGVQDPMNTRPIVTSTHPKLTMLVVYLFILLAMLIEKAVSLQTRLLDVWDKRCDDLSSGHGEAFDGKFLIFYSVFLILFKILPPIVSLGFNLKLWCFLRNYSRAAQQQLNHNLNQQNQNQSEQVDNRQQRLNSTNHNQETGFQEDAASETVNSLTGSNLTNNHHNNHHHHHHHQNHQRHNEVMIVSSRTPDTRNSYHLTLIMLNIADLPYDCYLLVDLLFSIFNDQWATDHRSLIVYLMLIVLLISRSSNFFIYIVFHREFRAAALQILCRICPFMKKCRCGGSGVGETFNELSVINRTGSARSHHHHHHQQQQPSSAGLTKNRNRESLVSRTVHCSQSIVERNDE